MKFQFEGNDYVIAFAHDPSRDWAAHALHDVVLVGPELGHDIDGLQASPCVALYCSRCNVKLSHIPKDQRARLTSCRIYQLTSVAGVANKVEIAHATGRCNPRDRWTREGGRLAALRNALDAFAIDKDRKALATSAGEWVWPDDRVKAFRAAAWEAYQTRHWNTQVEQLAAADRALAAARSKTAEGGAQ